MAMIDLRAFVTGLPKAELHLHIEGTLEPELMVAFAQRNGIRIPFDSVDEVRAAYRFSNLQDFLDIYYQGAAVLIHEADFHDLAAAYFDRIAEEGVVHAEIMFDPQTHTDRGIAFETVIRGLLSACEAAEKQHGITSRLICSFLRHLSEQAAFETLDQATPWRDRIEAVGLDSSEVGHPPAKFARVFAEARRRGFRLCAHAGEEGPPAYVAEALDLLHVDRLDHGNRSLEDEALTRRLANSGMTLTVCPLSNVSLRNVPRIEDHPIDRMLGLGLAATVNSDDPAYFGGYMVDNFMAVAEGRDLSRGDLVQLARNSITGSFLPPAEVERHLAAIDAYAEGAA